MAGKAAAKVYRSVRWKSVRLEVLEASNWRCSICANYANEVHHIVPIFRGGAPYDKANLRAVCRACHFETHRPRTTKRLRRDIREIQAIVTRLLRKKRNVC